MKYAIICCLVILSAAFTSCKENVQVKNSGDLEAIPVRMIESQASAMQAPPPAPPAPPAEKKVKIYKLVSGNLATIETNVNNEISTGWQPIGGIVFSGNNYVQAMVGYQ